MPSLLAAFQDSFTDELQGPYQSARRSEDESQDTQESSGGESDQDANVQVHVRLLAASLQAFPALRPVCASLCHVQAQTAKQKRPAKKRKVEEVEISGESTLAGESYKGWLSWHSGHCQECD